MGSAPERFGRYRVTGTLGAGAMGDVYAGHDEALGREVAIKVLKPQRNELAAAIVDERFRSEARAIASLTHPNVVVVFDIGLDADPPYLVMERVGGASLKDRLAHGALPEAEVRALGIQIARALAAAHERGIVHRDVKPANILDAGNGTWKLADFGVAHVPDSSLTMTGQFVGSPAYAAPEALVRGQSDREADVFGLGATLYHAATGTWPRLEQTTSGLLAPLPPLAATALSLPLARAIDRAVRMEPHERPRAAEFADELAHATSQELPAQPASPQHAVVPRAVPAASLHEATSISGASGAMQPVGQTAWKPWAIAGGVALIVLVLVGVTRRDEPVAPAAVTPAAVVEEPAPPPPARRPGGKAGKDWNKVLDHLERGNVREARKKLDEWERKHGATPESEALRAQLATMPEDEHGPPGHRREHDD